MTGLVTWENLTWIVGLIIVAGGTVAGFLIWLYRGLRDRERELDTRFETIELSISAARAELQAAMTQLADNLSKYQIHVAETFATKAGMTAAIERLEKGVDRLSKQVDDRFDRLTSRIDRLVVLTDKSDT